MKKRYQANERKHRAFEKAFYKMMQCPKIVKAAGRTMAWRNKVWGMTPSDVLEGVKNGTF